MHKDTAIIAKAYYAAMAEKNIDDLTQYLDQNVVFVAPLATVTSKQNFVDTLQKFITFFRTLKIRSVFGSQDEAMVVYTLDFPGSIGKVETAAFLNFKDGLITKIELFYDARPFEKK